MLQGHPQALPQSGETAASGGPCQIVVCPQLLPIPSLGYVPFVHRTTAELEGPPGGVRECRDGPGGGGAVVLSCPRSFVETPGDFLGGWLSSAMGLLDLEASLPTDGADISMLVFL